MVSGGSLVPPTDGRDAGGSVIADRRSRWLLIAVLALSVILRVGAALYFGNSLEETRGGAGDQTSYDMLGQRMVAGYGYSFPQNWWPYARAGAPTAFWSFLYPVFLAANYAVVGHDPVVPRVIQAVATGILTPWLVYRIGSTAFNRRAGIVAAGISAVYLYFVTFSASLMTESFYIVAVLWVFDAAIRLAVGLDEPRSTKWLMARGIELGFAMATATLLRQVFSLFFPVLIVWLLWRGWRNACVSALARTLLVALVVFVSALLPVVVRNYRIFGHISMPNANAGSTFYWSNHPIYGTRFVPVLPANSPVGYGDLIPPDLRANPNEIEVDRALLARGMQFVRDDPERYLRLSLSRIPVFFQFWPTRDSSTISNVSRVLSFGLFLPFMALGLALALRPGAAAVAGNERATAEEARAIRSLLIAFAVVYTAIHLASWANIRYRLPVDAILITFAGFAIVALADAIRRKTGRVRT